MTVLQRLKLELNNQQLLTDAEYTTVLSENELTATEPYIKATHQKKLLYSVMDILEIMSNDLDSYKRVQTEFMTTDQALDNLTNRINSIKNRIYELNSTTKDSMVSMLFFN